MNIKMNITSRSPLAEHFCQPTDLKIRFLLNSTILCSVGLWNMEKTFLYTVHRHKKNIFDEKHGSFFFSLSLIEFFL